MPPPSDGLADADGELWRWHDDAWPQISAPGQLPARETSFGDPALSPDTSVGGVFWQ